jgi:hypothetical protein
MRLYGKCSPTNCDRGWTRAQQRRASGNIPGFYDQGFAKRYVDAQMSKYRPGRLRVSVRTDFVDPGRADHQSQDRFVRAR